VRIKVRLHGSLKRYGDWKEGLLGFNVPEGTTVGDVLGRLNLPRSEIWLTVINGQLTQVGTKLEDGDELDIFPPVAGG
jgi:molybdopterin synthase sulfur carrier subunit